MITATAPTSSRRPTQTVPRHMFGCWDRRSIRLPADSATEETGVRVVWVQTPCGHGDIRIPQTTTRRDDASTIMSSLAASSDAQLLELAAAADSSCGQCELSPHTTRSSMRSNQQQQQARWTFGATGFAQQVFNPWPETGWLEWPMTTSDKKNDDPRPCMMEYAPDDQYLEDWRLCPGSFGMCCHLTTTDLPRRNMYIAGRHLLLAMDRIESPTDDDQRPLVDICRDLLVCPDGGDDSSSSSRRTRNRQQVERYLSSEFSYATRQKDPSHTTRGNFCIALSTLPWRQGHSISMQWLWKALLLEEEEDDDDDYNLEDRVVDWQAKEATMIGTDEQGVPWTLVSIDYRPPPPSVEEEEAS